MTFLMPDEILSFHIAQQEAALREMSASGR
jgi:hypothetical protein